MTKQEQVRQKVRLRNLFRSGPLFAVTITVIVAVLLLVWLGGLRAHHTLFVNSLLATSILSCIFFFFVTIGLFIGAKLKDTIGRVTDRIKLLKMPGFDGFAFDGGTAGSGCLAELAELFFSIVAVVIIVLLLWLSVHVLWLTVLLSIATLYWVFFRAVRLVFRHSAKCKGRLLLSAGYGLGYTILYNFWVYGTITILHYFFP